jgi:glycosyltransferase involved in cell wall biosynthesis
VRILHIITTLDVGGAEMHLLSQVRGQSARGHGVRVLYLKGQGTLAEDFRAAGAEYVRGVSLGLGTPSRLAPHLRWADICHSHLLKADMVTALCASLYGRRRGLVSGKHNDEQVLRNPLVSLVHGLVGRLPARTIVLSDHVGSFIQRHGRIPRRNMRRVYYGIDPAPFEEARAQFAAGTPELTAGADEEQAAGPAQRRNLRASFGFADEHVVLICVARFAAQKAHPLLLRAFDRARQTAPELRLLLVGDDPFGDGRVRAEAVARELDLGDSCVFAGIRRDVPLLMAASEVFIMSSLWEGLGLVFLEAMCVGLPIVGSDVSAVPEVVVNGETGLLVPPGEEQPLAAAMVRVAGDERLRRDLGQAGRRRVASVFNLDRMVDETLAVYDELL